MMLLLFFLFFLLLLRQPLISTRTYTLFPYSTLFRSRVSRRDSDRQPSRRGFARRAQSRTFLRAAARPHLPADDGADRAQQHRDPGDAQTLFRGRRGDEGGRRRRRSEEHTSELQSLMRISYAVFCLKKKNK